MSRLLAALKRLLATKWGKIVKRVVIGGLVAGAITFGNLATVSELFSPAHVTDLSLWRKALLGAEGASVGAVLTAVQSLITQWLAGTPELLALLHLASKQGRCQATAARREARAAGHLNQVRALPAGVKFGKQPAAPIGDCARLDRHLSPDLPAPLPTLDWTARLSTRKPFDWGMMLNDRLGCCTCAAVGHAIQLLTGVARGVARTLTDAQILALYESVSGYNPRSGANDNGALEADVLARWASCGVSGDRIAAYGRVEHTNHDAIKQTIQLLGFAYVGTQVPQTWETAPAVWGVSPAPIVGGHAIVYVGWDDTGFKLISWGREFTITYAAHDAYVDEVWGVVSADWVAADGESPSGLDLSGLRGDLDALDAA